MKTTGIEITQINECPVCESTSIEINESSHGLYLYCKCKKCGFQTDFEDNMHDAILKWNKVSDANMNFKNAL